MRFLVALAGVLVGGAAGAVAGPACHVGDNFVRADFPLPHVARAIAAKHLDIVVVGSASSAIAGPGGAGKAYPVRFEAVLAERFPSVAVRVVTYAKPRQSAAEMESEVERLVTAEKPALVVWQTGTADAIRGIDPDEFRNAVDEGVEALQQAGTDVVLMNMQYSPRTEQMIALGAYADALRFVALQREINLFDRWSIMRHWSELGTFDLYAATKKTDLAERVHDCIGRLLAGLVAEGVSLTESANKENH